MHGWAHKECEAGWSLMFCDGVRVGIEWSTRIVMESKCMLF